MNATEIEFAVRDLVAERYDSATFPFEFIAIYNASAMTVSRLKSGTTNKAREPGDMLWPRKLFFRPATLTEDVGAVADTLASDPLTARHKPRFIVVTNGQQVHARDLTLGDTMNVEFERLDDQAYFLLPLAGYERRAIMDEHPADIKAAKKLKKLYDALLAANPAWNTGHHSHELNLLMTRLLFCFYAEKTRIFEIPKVFTTTLEQTNEDGREVAPLLDRLFRVMNLTEAKRPETLLASERNFPYVNGSLFDDTVEIPVFNRTARRQLLECGDLDWTTINPDIFGSMIQTIAQDGTRSDLGMHYTSVPNIMKVLRPLLLDELHESFLRARDNAPKLRALLGRLSNIRVFDPACGSGNFLVIAYKELRRLEIEVLKHVAELSNAPLPLSTIGVKHFYGIDVVDFACETAKLSLWIAEHQMNVAFKDVFGSSRPTLPLAKIETIVCTNSLNVDWLTFCPVGDNKETFLCGNPPYAGRKHQTREQKDDIKRIFSPVAESYGHIDYVGCFFLLAARYIKHTSGQAAFVSTNSICQGEQVSILWPPIFDDGILISFAYTSFEWGNNASHKAGVTCIIVGLSTAQNTKSKVIYDGEHVKRVKAIGPYLVPDSTIIVKRLPQPINGLPAIAAGTQPTDDGHLTMTANEAANLITRYPSAKEFIRKYLGGDDILNSTDRYCLWITDDSAEEAAAIPGIANRLHAVSVARAKSPDKATQRLAQLPYKFVKTHRMEAAAIVIPKVSSERRRFLPMTIVDPSVIANNTLYVIYFDVLSTFALLSTRMHRLWLGAVGGRMRTDLQYSSSIVYNAFPIPSLSETQKETLGEYSKAILKSRARHPGKTLAMLYDPNAMPSDLLASHVSNDAYVEEQIYGRNFRDDTHRLEHLFEMYSRLKPQSDQNSLFSST
jgi:hypothetical protein